MFVCVCVCLSVCVCVYKCVSVCVCVYVQLNLFYFYFQEGENGKVLLNTAELGPMAFLYKTFLQSALINKKIYFQEGENGKVLKLYMRNGAMDKGIFKFTGHFGGMP